MSYWSHNPELLEEITIKFLPEPWKSQVENGDILLSEVPSDIHDKAMLEGEKDYWGDQIDKAMLTNEDNMIEKSLKA
jgi:hypothetical protein